MARVIKKYPNRRLYDTETSAYITLAEVTQFVLAHENFLVQDARSGEDLTRSILLQIILEEESGGVPMFSSDMLANVIRYYGHSMQGLMGSYLERSIGAFHEAQKKFQEQSSALYGAVPNFRPDAWAQLVPGAANIPMGDFLEKSASSVISMQEELRKQAMQMFSAFPYAAPSATAQPAADKPESEPVAPRAKTRRGK
jgi:polyhydroxyalkanoate synthesis repressor PhaR